MADRIPKDPCLEVLLDHTGPHYNDIRLLLLNTGLTLEQAIQSLNDSWTQTRDKPIQAWDQQVLADNNEAEEAQRLLQEEEQLRLQQKQQDKENKHLEAEKKRPKMNDFEETTIVSNYIAPRPSQYTLCQLENWISQAVVPNSGRLCGRSPAPAYPEWRHLWADQGWWRCGT